MNFPRIEQAIAAAIECATRTNVEVSIYEQIYPLGPGEGLPDFCRYEVNISEGSPPNIYAYRRIARCNGDQVNQCDETLFPDGDNRVEPYREWVRQQHKRHTQ